MPAMMITIKRYLSIKIRFGIAVFCALFSMHAFAESLDCPAFPVPDVKVQWVAPYMIFNGIPMSIKRIDSGNKSVEDILNFYRRAWASGTPGLKPVENDAPPWKTIGVVRGKCFFSVQVQAAGQGTTGLLSATQPEARPRVIAADKVLPMMTGSTIINDIEHRDDGKNARTLLLSNAFSTASNADFYRQSLSDQGWQILSSYQMTTAQGPGITVLLKRGLAETNIVITREGAKTMVLANMVDQP